MRILDATSLVDYPNGVDATAEYLLAHEDERFILPAPAYAEALVGEGNLPDGDVAEAKAGLSWGEVYETGKETAETAGEVATKSVRRGRSSQGWTVSSPPSAGNWKRPSFQRTVISLTRR
jgi:hypothetical protein